MNMNMPRFTAEASLSRVSGHYRSSRNAFNASAQITSGIYTSLMGEEVIHIHSCAPGWTDIGGVCFPPPLTEPSGGGGGQGPSPVDEPGRGGGRGGGGGHTEARDANGCTFRQFNSKIAKPCRDKQEEDKKNNVAKHYLQCKGTKIECCEKRGKFRDECKECNRSGCNKPT
jgi:hypothetical protein